MPSYLIAIAVGNLEYRSLGRRVGVITEPENIDLSADVLGNLEELLDSVENYLGPYVWGNYTILVLPPSFPFGGMENPLLTFASPTIITSDKSQVYVATHEIAHSWTGNIGCMTQISSGTKIPIVHTIEILNWYTGGSKPTAINLL